MPKKAAKKKTSPKKKGSSKKRTRKPKKAETTPRLLSPSESQKVRLALLLLLCFLTAFSLATGALETGMSMKKGWHLAAFDTQGTCRMKLAVSLHHAPKFSMFDGRGKKLIGEESH